MAMVVSGMMATDTPAVQNQTIVAKPEVVAASSTQAAVGRTTTQTTSNQGGNKSQKETNPNEGIESFTREYFKDIPLMAEIAKCESRYRQFNRDGSTFRGVVNNKDVGVMQINEFYHLERAKKLNINIYTVEGNLEYGKLLYSEKGSQPWKSSAPCWMKSDVAKAMFNTNPVLAEK
ncbi:MAG: lytic transglycosylase domain-containing protein [Candidatus Taylorbacteria bacterium]|nr:lytic transglycosylase domain-containing protein [Candidatus Taylorbacteria bacterium]